MDQTNENAQGQKPKITWLIIVSLSAIILGFLAGFVLKASLHVNIISCSMQCWALLVFLFSPLIGISLGLVRQKQKPEICRLAIISSFVVILGFVGGTALVFWNGGMAVLVFLASSCAGLASGIAACRKIHKSKGMLRGYMFSISAIGLALFCLLFFLTFPPLCAVPRTHNKVLCGANLAGLGKAMQVYSDRYDQKYPTPDSWCDLLLERADIDEQNFLCEGALKNGDKGRSHYALNPNCAPSSPNDVVLLFETKGGWNKFGGPELLTAEHHQSEGANILFNNGEVEFIKTDRLGKLKWDNNPKDRRE